MDVARGPARDEEFHLAFGLHSGIPLCCAYHFAYDGGKGGPCPSCEENGVTKEELFSQYHWCSGNNPQCVPYLERLEENAIAAYKEGYRKDPQRPVGDDAYGIWLQLPMGPLRDILKDDGWLMAHLCWPGPSEYWYIFLKHGSKEKGKCGVCGKKFSLKFPTTGKSVL